MFLCSRKWEEENQVASIYNPINEENPPKNMPTEYNTMSNASEIKINFIINVIKSTKNLPLNIKFTKKKYFYAT